MPEPPARDRYIELLSQIGTYKEYGSLLLVFIFFEQCCSHRDFGDCQVNIEPVPGFKANEKGWFGEILFDCCKSMVAFLIPVGLLGPL